MVTQHICSSDLLVSQAHESGDDTRMFACYLQHSYKANEWSYCKNMLHLICSVSATGKQTRPNRRARFSKNSNFSERKLSRVRILVILVSCGWKAAKTGKEQENDM